MKAGRKPLTKKEKARRAKERREMDQAMAITVRCFAALNLIVRAYRESKKREQQLTDGEGI